MGLRRAGRATSLAAAAAAFAMVLAACGGSDSGSDTGADAGGGTLTLWHMEQPPHRVEAWQKLIDRYNATNPKWKVEQQVQDWNQIYSKIASAVQSGTQPDILFTIPDFTTYVRTLGGVRDVSGVVNEVDGKHQFLDAAKAAYSQDGQFWAVPMYGMVQVLWYRKDLLAQAGITEAPTTWDELLAAAEAATTDTQSGIALPAGKNLATDQVIYSFMLTNGAGDFFDGSGSPNFDRPEVVETFDFYNKLMAFSPKDSANYSWGEPQAALNSGAAAMAIEKGQYLLPFESESGRPAEDLGCALIPQPNGGQPGSIYYSNGAMVMSPDDDRAAGAEAFLAWLLEPETYGEFLNAEPGLFLPLTESGMQAASWSSDPTITKYRGCVDLMLEQSKSGALFGFYNGQYIESIGLISGQNVLAQVIQDIVVQGSTPADAVSKGQQLMLDAVAGG